MHSTHIPRPLKILAALYVVYLALVLAIATPAVNIVAPKIYREQTGRELTFEKIVWLNPFTLTVKVRGASSLNPDHSRFWSCDALTANLSLASLWRRHIVLDALELHGFYLQIDETAPDRFNFSDILDYRAKQFRAAPQSSAPPATDNNAFPIEIDKLVLSAAHLGYRAPFAATPLAIKIAGATIALTDFSTLSPRKSSAPSPGNGATRQAGSEIKAASTLPALRASHITFDLTSIDVDFLRAEQPFSTGLRNIKIAMPALSTAANDAQNFSLSLLDASGGTVKIQGNTALAQSRAEGNAQLQALNVIPAWQFVADKLAFETQSARLDGEIHFQLDWRDRFFYRVDDSQLTLRDVRLQSRADADTSAAFQSLHVEGIAIDGAQSLARIARMTLEQPRLRGWNRDTDISLLDMFAMPHGDEPAQPSPWQIAVDVIDVAAGAIDWRTSHLDNRALTVAPLALHASNLHWPDAAPMQFNATTSIRSAGDTKTEIKIALDGALVPSDLSGKINGSISDLPLTWGNIFAQRELRALIADGTLNAKFTATLDKAKPTLVQSDGSIERFELQAQMPSQKSGSAGPKLAAWKKMQWQQLALLPSTQRIDIKRIIVSDPWAQFRINSDGTNNFQQLLVNSSAAANPDTSAEKKSASKLTGAPAKNGTAEKSWQFAVDNIHVDNATIDFRDASLSSAFRTDITQLSGDINGLDSGGKHSAKIGLRGTVDGYAPVALTGAVNPFALKPMVEVTLDITNLDLASLTPYSGTYAGYQIDGGRLTIQLTYTLENGRIKGTNHIVVNQMQLGRQVTGPKVIDLPLRLAIYLLTDANGVMDLGVDVTGDVNDPNFSVGSIIWKAFRNMIVKTATSPFRALARLAGGLDDNIDRVEFKPGNSQLDDNQQKKLKTLNTALQQKTALKISISGHVSPSQDLEALRDEQLSSALIAQGGISRNDIATQSPSWQREVVKLFEKRFAHETTAGKQVMQMNDAMRDNEELAPSALQELAAQRALAVKESLVAGYGLGADRAFLKPVDLGADKNPGLQATMQLE